MSLSSLTRQPAAADPSGRRSALATDRRGLIRSMFGIGGALAGIVLTGSRPARAATDAAFATTAASTPAVASSSTATLASVPATNTSVLLLRANPSRLGATVFNDSSAPLYLAFGPTASRDAFTVRLLPEGFFELPAPVFAGDISGVWGAAVPGAARVTETT